MKCFQLNNSNKLSKKTKILAISMLLIFSFLNNFAQNKDFDKLQKLYQSSQYDKCIEKAKDLTSKYAQSPIPYYYLGLSNFQNYIISPKIRKKIMLSTTLNNIKNAIKRDKDSSQYQNFSKELKQIHDTTLYFTQQLEQTDKNAAGDFYKYLAEVFKDTTVQYREMFMPKQNVTHQQLAFRENTGPTNQTDIAGNRQGIWISKYPNGLVKSEIFFKDNHPAGVFRKYHENGNLRADMYFNSDGERSSAILYNQDGKKVAMGYFKGKEKDSMWQYFYNDSTLIAVENYKNGIKNGAERNFSYLGPVMLEEKFWKNGTLDSTWNRYTIDGKLRFEANYKNGVRTGKYMIYDDNGTPIIIGYYKDNLPTGTWNYWNDSTKKYIKIQYVNGQPKNIDKLSDQENKLFQQMDQMKGKLEEPSDYIKREYEGGNE